MVRILNQDFFDFWVESRSLCGDFLVGRISPKNAPGYRVVTSSVTYWDSFRLKTFSSLSPTPIVSKRFFFLHVTQVKKISVYKRKKIFVCQHFMLKLFFLSSKQFLPESFNSCEATKKIISDFFCSSIKNFK